MTVTAKGGATGRGKPGECPPALKAPPQHEPTAATPTGSSYFFTVAATSGSGSAVVDLIRSMLMRELTFFGRTATISRL